jgi:hypothetical protein
MKALECRAKMEPPFDCEHCEYCDKSDGFESCDAKKLATDVLKLIKGPEAHILTPEEIDRIQPGNSIYEEWKIYHKDDQTWSHGLEQWVVAPDFNAYDGASMIYDMNYFKKIEPNEDDTSISLVRFWSKEPTEEQMTATEW